MSESKSAPRKPKLVRDSFTIPKTEYAAIDELKTRAIALGTSVKKSELLRAGLMALVGMSDAAFKAAVAAVPTLKPGRPQAEPASTPVPKPAPARKAAARKAAPKKAVATKPAARKPAVKAAPASAPPESPSGAPRRARGGAATTRRPS
ncbi:hypothetical protein [Hydrogenophaga sp. IBVHS2]|uniref:hypothetical protein n=1 Tax=Hydrogenophaga sp. IBVHS2 TaxID=1985170 RepID=UPI001179A8FD|nr:hypothetical protein [Hydrogenophaga sp. IBVHS2]